LFFSAPAANGVFSPLRYCWVLSVGSNWVWNRFLVVHFHLVLVCATPALTPGQIDPAFVGHFDSGFVCRGFPRGGPGRYRPPPSPPFSFFSPWRGARSAPSAPVFRRCPACDSVFMRFFSRPPVSLLHQVSSAPKRVPFY